MTNNNAASGVADDRAAQVVTPQPLAAGRNFDWRDPFFQVGVVLSVCWSVASIVVLCAWANWPEKGLPPNEWGDLAAGVAAPLAFFWLVLGFLQQGKELRLSSSALMLQVEELRNTVKHQADLVAATREQVAMRLRQEHMENQERRRAVRPHFVLSLGRSTVNHYGAEYTIKLRNTGVAVTNVEVTGDGREERKHISVVDETDRTFELKFSAPPENPIRLSITYTDADNYPGRADYLGKLKAGYFRFDQQVVPLGALAPSSLPEDG